MSAKKLLLASIVLVSLVGFTVPAFAFEPGDTGAGVPRGTQPAPAPSADSFVRNQATAETPPEGCSWVNWSACANDIKNAVIEGVGTALSQVGGAAVSFGLDLLIKIFAYIAGLIFVISQFFLWMGAMLLDQALKFLVLEMGVFVSGNGPAQTIRLAWVAIRDLMNLAIVAGFIAVGISTILQVAQYNASKFLTRLIIAALLVNFSFFFAGAMIDAANFVTVKIYESKIFQSNCVISDIAVAGSEVPGTRISTADICTISNAFMVSTKLGTLEDLNKLSGSGGLTEGSRSYDLKFLILALFGSILFFVAGFVFFAAGILLIGRFVALILLLVTSPLGIAGTQIPYIDKYAGKWWSEFTSQVLFAPTYMILIAISFQVIKGTTSFLQQKSGGNASLAAIGSGDFNYTIESAMPLVLSFFIAVSFMWTALKIAQDMSKSEYFKDVYGFLDKRFGGLYGSAYNLTMGNLSKAPSFAYDKTFGYLLDKSYIGKPLDRAISRTLRSPQSDKPFGGTSMRDQEKNASDANKARTAELGTDKTKAQRTLEREADARNEELKRLINMTGRTAEQDAELRRLLEGKTLEQILAATGGDISKVAHLLTDKQLEEFMKSDKFSSADKEKAFGARYAALDAAFASGNDDEIKKILSEMSETEAKLYYNQRRQLWQDKKNADRFANSVSGKQADAIHSDPTLMTKEQRKEFTDTRLGIIRNPDGSVKSVDSDKVAANAGKLSERELNELPHGEFVKLIKAKKVKPSVIRKRISRTSNSIDEENELRSAAEEAGVNLGADPGAIAN